MALTVINFKERRKCIFGSDVIPSPIKKGFNKMHGVKLSVEIEVEK
jgi:hypothetical protein